MKTTANLLGAALVGCMLLTHWASAGEIAGRKDKVAGSQNAQTIRLNGDTLFPFDGDTLSSGGKTALNELLKQGTLIPMTTYRITGHTDRIGGAMANGDLSVRRAEAVRKYLLSRNGNLQLQVNGKGKNHPLVQCSTGLPRGEQIKCLAPNRRVEIDPIY